MSGALTGLWGREALRRANHANSRAGVSASRFNAAEAEAAIARLLELVEKGLMGTEDPALRERLIGLKLRRDELAKDAGDLQRHIASGEPQITPDKIGKVAILLPDKLRHGPLELRQAYARLVMDEVSVTDQEVRISGSKSVLARCAAAGEMPAAPAVLSFVQDWRARQDSNLWPLPSEGSGVARALLARLLSRYRQPHIPTAKKGLAFGSKRSVCMDIPAARSRCPADP
jgi:hypothetical protein